MKRIFSSLLCIVFAVSGSLANFPALVDMSLAYFRYHNIGNVLVLSCGCESDVGQNQQMTRVVQKFLENSLYTRAFMVVAGEANALGKNSSRYLQQSSANFTSHFQPERYKTGILVLNFTSMCALNVLQLSTLAVTNPFTVHRFWLLLAESAAVINGLNAALPQLFIPPDSEVRFLVTPERTGKRNNLRLVDVYNVVAGKPIKQRSICEELNNGNDLVTALQRFGSAISYRENLEGTIFRTGLVIAFPDMFTNINDLSLRHIDTIAKVNNKLTIELANQLNIRFNTYQTDNYGWHQPNGSFDGMMGRFQRNELDFAQNGLLMRLDRIALVDFVAETFRIRAGLMFRQPPLSAVANIFAMPFEGDVWLSIILLMIFTVIVLSAELIFSPHAHDMDILDCVIFVWGALCQQGFHVATRNRSARIVVFTTFVATLFLFTSFSANIVALLQTPSEAIRTLSDLSQSPLEIGVQDTVYNKVYFNESTDPITNQLYRKKIAPKGESIYMRPMIGIQKMRTGLFAYQVELQAGYQIISDTFSEHEKCGLKELEPFQLPMLAIATRKNFPYRELFRRQLRWQREVGLMNREQRKWFPQRPKCEGGVGGFVSIGLTECRYALAMYGYGLLLGLLMFALEILSKYFIKRASFAIPHEFARNRKPT